MKPIKDFLERERELRRLSKSEFADQLGISEKSYYRFTKDHEPDVPSDELLKVMADNLHLPLTALWEQKYGVVEASELSGKSQLVAQDYERLPVEFQEIVDMLIRSLKNRL